MLSSISSASAEFRMRIPPRRILAGKYARYLNGSHSKSRPSPQENQVTKAEVPTEELTLQQFQGHHVPGEQVVQHHVDEQQRADFQERERDQAKQGCDQESDDKAHQQRGEGSPRT